MALIGISGKLGSGKDTVGEIIQYLTGVDADGKFTKGLNWSYSSNFEIKKFAGKLKMVGALLSGADVKDFEDQGFKKRDMSSEWGMTYREFLQKLGTEAMRDGLHTNVWVNALFADYKGLVKEWDEFGNDLLVEYPNWVITDMRFPNEMEAIEERGGITIRVERPKPREMFLMNATTVIDTRIPEHPSETALDDARFDYVIDNDGTLDELVQKVKDILIEEGIL